MAAGGGKEALQAGGVFEGKKKGKNMQVGCKMNRFIDLMVKMGDL